MATALHLWGLLPNSSCAWRSFATVARRPDAAGAPWPFLRNKALLGELQSFLQASKPPRNDAPALLWLAGARGSGAGTAVQAVVAQLASAQAGPGAVVLLDLRAEVTPHNAAATESTAAPQIWLGKIAETLRKGLSPLGTGPDADARAKAAVSFVLQRHPEAGAALRKVVEAMANRAGLPGALVMGTEMPACREALNAHPDDSLALAMRVSELVAGAQKSKRQSSSLLDAALVLLRNASEQGASGPLGPVAYLLTAAEGIAQSGTPVAVALVHAEELSQPWQALTQPAELRPAARELWRALQEASRGGLRLLVHSCDGVAGVRAKEEGAEVLSMDEWTERMAQATIVPRFMEAEEAKGWEALWATVGGHPAHLRLAAELLQEERRGQEVERRKTAAEDRKTEQLRSRRPKRSADAEAFAKEAEQQFHADSFRADAPGDMGVGESLMRRLPEELEQEVASFESQVSLLLQHPWLQGLGASGPPLASRIIECCEAGPVSAPAAGLGALADPVQLALLDVGLLVPCWRQQPRLRWASEMQRRLLLAWAEALKSGS